MALSVDSSRAYGNFFFVFFPVSACDVICFETEIILWHHNLCEKHAILATHTRPSAVFLEKSKRLYTICCATVS